MQITAPLLIDAITNTVRHCMCRPECLPARAHCPVTWCVGNGVRASQGRERMSLPCEWGLFFDMRAIQREYGLTRCHGADWALRRCKGLETGKGHPLRWPLCSAYCAYVDDIRTSSRRMSSAYRGSQALACHLDFQHRRLQILPARLEPPDNARSPSIPFAHD